MFVNLSVWFSLQIKIKPKIKILGFILINLIVTLYMVLWDTLHQSLENIRYDM